MVSLGRLGMQAGLRLVSKVAGLWLAVFAGTAAIASVLPIKSTVRLINHRKTVNTVPLANFQNFRRAVHAIGSIMDKDNDVLILLMTSHGDRTGFALQLPGSITELTPRQVAAALD